MPNIDLIRPIGSIFETIDINFDPNIEWGGTWIIDTTESVLVSQSTANIFSANINSIVGSNTAIANLPSHSHTANAAIPVYGSTQLFQARTYQGGGSWGLYGNGTWTAVSTGSSQPHENRMRSMYVIRWIRTA